MASTRSILRAAKYSPGGARPTPAPQGTQPYFGAMSPLAMNLADQHGYANAYSGFLPRPPSAFTQGAFGPFSPILPVPVDEPEESGRAEPRATEYRVGWNLPVGTPGSEGIKLATFSTLKTLADLYSVARACIQLRKAEVRGLEWDIMPTQDSAKANRGDKGWFKDFGSRRAKALKFFRRPDPDYYSWNTWIDALLEEVFVFDALSLYLRPKRGKGMGKGLLSSDLDSLSLINGPTIRPLYDMHGGYPAPPSPAYQQYLYGVPRSDFIKMLTDKDIEESGLKGSQLGAFRGDQLLYMPMTPRRWTPYGFPPIERAMIPVLTGLQKQGWQLDFFREGTVPAVYMSPGDENMTPNQIRELQDALNAFAGDIAWNHKIIVLPPGTRVEPQRNAQLADQFDEIVMTQVCMAFDVMPMELGIAPKVSTSMSPGASHQMAKMAQDVGERKATKPTLMFISDIMNGILNYTCGQDDMQFVFEGLEATEDQVQLTELLVNQVTNGLRSIDEARDELNLQPWGLPETSGPLFLAPTGPMPFTTPAIAPGQQSPSGSAAPAQTAPGRAVLPNTGPKTPPVAAGSGQMPTSTQSTALPQLPPHQETPGHVAAQGVHNQGSSKPAMKPVSSKELDTTVLEKAANSELEALSRHIKKGRQISTWIPKNITADSVARISQGMAEGLEVDDAIKVVKATRRIVSLNGQESWINSQIPFDAAGGGGRSPIRHLNDGTEIPGGVPESSAGGEPPRWTPSQPPNGYMGGFYDRSDRTQASHVDGGDDSRQPVGTRHDANIYGNAQRNYPGGNGGQWPSGGVGTEQASGFVVPGDANDRGRAPAVGDVPRRVVGHASKAGKISKESVNYRPAETRAESCGTCVMFQPSSFSCTLVTGPIQSDDTCDRWYPGTSTKGACVAAGLIVRAADSGRVLMLQRALTDEDPAAGKWEFPGGCLEAGEQSQNAAVREWQEETGIVLPVGTFSPGWSTDSGNYVCYVYQVGSEDDVPILDGRDKVPNPDDPDGDITEAIAWWDPDDIADCPAMRPELLDNLDLVLNSLTKAAAKHSISVDPSVIEDLMKRNFSTEGYSWVHDAIWIGPVSVPMKQIDFSNEDTWAAHHEDNAVSHFEDKLRNGEHVHPAILVKTPDDPKLKVIDGHHRTLANKNLNQSVRAFVGTVPTTVGPWDEAHSFQIHHGKDSLNKAGGGNAAHLIDWYNGGAGGRIKWGGEGDFQQCVDIASEHMDLDQAHGFCQLRHIDATGIATATHAAEERGH